MKREVKIIFKILLVLMAGFIIPIGYGINIHGSGAMEYLYFSILMGYVMWAMFLAGLLCLYLAFYGIGKQIIKWIME